MQCLVLCSHQTMTKIVMAQFGLWNVRQKCNGIKSRWNVKILHLKNAAIQIDRNETNSQGWTGLLAVPPAESLEPLTWVTTANTNETTQTDTGNLHIQSSADRFFLPLCWTNLVVYLLWMLPPFWQTCKGTQTAYTAKGDRLYTLQAMSTFSRQSCFCQRCYSKQHIRRNDTH